ncbi:Protein ref(2)P [Eumeta japonica]|uniref:Protein ref(2)P n=1 Tax=Eumeta variegata TaxID=151549 RepID=A0A4C1URG2_EUMVA|nr:Protein ref(2)P [Eumeta japonica]
MPEWKGRVPLTRSHCERITQILWLRAAQREDLLKNNTDKVTVSHRFCSRHFPPSSIKNRHLCPDAVPSLFLPGSQDPANEKAENSDSEPEAHGCVVCDSCYNRIEGYRYKCVTCPDYDLCMKCEMRETHSKHYMLRIPKPLKFKLADDLIKKWRTFFKANHISLSDVESDGSGSDSNDDIPITKYFINKTDNSSFLSEDLKNLIKAEVARALSSKTKVNNAGTKRVNQKKPRNSHKGKRKREEEQAQNKRNKAEEFNSKEDDLYRPVAPKELVENRTKEVEFADVNEIKNDHFDGVIKTELVHNLDQGLLSLEAVKNQTSKPTQSKDTAVYAANFRHLQGNQNLQGASRELRILKFGTKQRLIA